MQKKQLELFLTSLQEKREALNVGIKYLNESIEKIKLKEAAILEEILKQQLLEEKRNGRCC